MVANVLKKNKISIVLIAVLVIVFGILISKYLIHDKNEQTFSEPETLQELEIRTNELKQEVINKIENNQYTYQTKDEALLISAAIDIADKGDCETARELLLLPTESENIEDEFNKHLSVLLCYRQKKDRAMYDTVRAGILETIASRSSVALAFYEKQLDNEYSYDFNPPESPTNEQ